jgi:hypothetical protein
MGAAARNPHADRAATGDSVTAFRPAAAGNTLAVPMSLFLNRMMTPRNSLRGSGIRRRTIAGSVKVVLTAPRRMHIAMLPRHVQAIFNNVVGCHLV